MSKSRDMDGMVVIGKIILDKPGSWSDEGRKHVARWLRRHANDLVKLGPNYNATGKFTGRYNVAAKDPL